MHYPPANSNPNMEML